MRFERKHGWFLLAVAGWGYYSWAMFARNLWNAWSAGEERPGGYWVAHTGLIVVNVALAVVFTVWGLRVLRAVRDAERPASPAEAGQTGRQE
ncbi:MULTISPECIES: SCO4848 family membrane protein [Nocardioides]|uniref:Integral membrane protein n=1 Tax=Nocardioides salarius TaxID=374513 RepID=A0ABS2MDJ8_9ACTN|nr:hypothetical protein [Nocardioides salarius]MBM7509266.1 hypothetical protein [Nocardioides salarius]